MSVYLEQYDCSAEDDQSNYCRMLETKLHYIMSMLQKAGIMLDADGKPVKSLPETTQSDADEVQSAIRNNW
jgi:hypothetical protein